MTKLIGILISIISIFISQSCLSMENISNNGNVATHLYINYYKGKIGVTEYLKKLRYCTKTGNLYCDSLLGDWLYSKEKYSEAYPYLIKASALNAASPHFALGYMYHYGCGVLQNNNKAISYYVKAAKLGDQNAAFNLGILYGSNAVFGKKYELIRSYAWFKLSQALGLIVVKKANGNTVKVSSLILACKNLLSENELKEANKLAYDLCKSTIDCRS